MSLTVLRLNTPDTDRVIAGIEAEVARAPKLFSGLPVLIDLNRHRVDIAQVADIARNQGLVPVAVVDADDDSAASARACGLGVLQQADLIIRAPVSAGAEVLADGSIHIYGPLRGRALAGCRGDETARIFCQSREAELVAVAGNYLVADDIASEHRSQPSMVRLVDETLTIENL